MATFLSIHIVVGSVISLLSMVTRANLPNDGKEVEDCGGLERARK